jgi:hypothetical protein
MEGPPARPVTIGFVLPANVETPSLVGATCERIEQPTAVPALSRPRNALVLHADAEPALLEGVLERAHQRSAMRVAAPVFVVGVVSDAHARLVARSGMFLQARHPGPRELVRTARIAVVFAHAHAEQDPLTQVEWARGTLGDWVAARYPMLGPAARVVLAMAAQGVYDPTRIAELLGRGVDVIYHHTTTIREVTGAPSLESAAGPFERMLAPMSTPCDYLATPRREALPPMTPVDGVQIANIDSE